MKIQKIENVGKLPVYDLTVEDKAQYILENGVVTHNTAVTYSANQIFVITKAQEKSSDGELEGWKFTINTFKSRFVKEKSKLPFNVMYDSGIQKYSGMLDLAIESGEVVKPKNGWYALVDKETGEISGNVRFNKTQTDEFLGEVVNRPTFKKFIVDKYKLSMSNPIEDIEVEDVYEDA